MSECPCGLKQTYDQCCEPIIKGEKDAQTAEQLMRTRYSAYVKGEIDYIINSITPKKREIQDHKATKSWSEKSIWHKLEILDTKNGGPDDDKGEVEFVAHYTYKGNRQKQHERSKFEKIDNQWFYVDGQPVLPKQVIRDTPKIGRNDSCPCGSGKKYKKCCGG